MLIDACIESDAPAQTNIRFDAYSSLRNHLVGVHSVHHEAHKRMEMQTNGFEKLLNS